MNGIRVEGSNQGRDLSRVKVVYFDFWRTLALSHKPDLIQEVQVILGHEYRGDDGNELPGVDPRLERFCDATNIADPQTFLSTASLMLDLPEPGPEQLAEFQEVLDKERGCIAEYIDVEPALAALYKKGYRLGIISNIWPFPLGNIYQHSKFMQFMDPELIILSCEVGHVKPEQEIYAEAARRACVSPDECLMVGDNMVTDIKGALDAGYNAAALIDRLGKFKKEDLQDVIYLRQLTELPELLPDRAA